MRSLQLFGSTFVTLPLARVRGPQAPEVLPSWCGFVALHQEGESLEKSHFSKPVRSGSRGL